MDNPRQDTLLDCVLGAIGSTPLVELACLTSGMAGRHVALGPIGSF